jgi:hypothetical protein
MIRSLYVLRVEQRLGVIQSVNRQVVVGIVYKPYQLVRNLEVATRLFSLSKLEKFVSASCQGLETL